MKQESVVQFEFPILVYRDEDVWVAQSLMTCTTAVNVDHQAALEELYRLLDLELDTALEEAQNNVDAALRMITCPAPEQLWARFFLGARALPSPPPSKARAKAGRAVTLSPREAATLV